MKNFKRTFAFIFAVIFSFSLTSLCASAAFGDSAVRTATVYGYTYSFGSMIHNEENGRISYQTNVAVSSTDTVPVGYMGVRARLYSESGALVSSTSFTYNTDETGGELAASGYNTTSGYYYSKGAVKLYNGTGYTSYDSYATPNFTPTNAYSLSGNNITVQRNENGEIYGSEIFLNQIGVNPDLILTENSTGIVGYVRADDLNNDDVLTPAEALATMVNKAPRSIPMYASNGETVVGTFVIDAV